LQWLVGKRLSSRFDFSYQPLLPRDFDRGRRFVFSIDRPYENVMCGANGPWRKVVSFSRLSLGRCKIQKADYWHCQLLRVGCKRPCCRSCNSLNKLHRRIACPSGLGPRGLRSNGFSTGETGFDGHFAQQQFSGAKCRYGSKATFPTPSRHVRSYPQSDRDNDLPLGRYVPLATKVQRSKMIAI
jgi:hypothetical protein